MHEGLSHIGMAALDALAALAAQFLHTGSKKHQELGGTKTMPGWNCVMGVDTGPEPDSGRCATCWPAPTIG